MDLCLRIKRRYFEQIRDGAKIYEYRALTQFYASRIGARLDLLKRVTFHYQSRERLTCMIDSIDIVETPNHFDPTETPTSHVYRLKLSQPRLWQL